MGKTVPLGRAAPAAEHVEVAEPQTADERFAALQLQIDQLAMALNEICSRESKGRRNHYNEVIEADTTNSDGIELGMSLLGESRRGGMHVLTVAPDGYYIGTNRYKSLSAAAEAASGVRRSGWTYWHYPDGRTAKEKLGK